MSFEIAKAGWLYRLSSVLRRWKKSWFVLYTDGVLKFFESPDSHVADEAYVIPTKCLLIKTGSQVSGVTPPQGLNASGLLMLVFVGDQTLTMCAESIDDMRGVADINGAGEGDPDEREPSSLFRHELQLRWTTSVFITVGDRRTWWLSHPDVLRHAPTTLRGPATRNDNSHLRRPTVLLPERLRWRRRSDGSGGRSSAWIAHVGPTALVVDRTKRRRRRREALIRLHDIYDSVISKSSADGETNDQGWAIIEIT